MTSPRRTAALALAGFFFAWTPAAERIDLALLDAQIAFLHKLGTGAAPDDIIMMPTATTTAMTITGSESAMPTAVITESSENTMSSSMIWKMTAPNDGATRSERSPSTPSSRS